MASWDLAKPFELEYYGRDADRHVVDGILLGRSLQGTARLYNSIASAYFDGPRVPPGKFVRVRIGPPKAGSLLYMFYLMTVHGTMPLYPQLLFEMAEFMIPAFIKGVIGMASGNREMLEKSLEVISEMAEQNANLAAEISKSGERDHAEKMRLYELMETLVTRNGPALKDMVAPIGRSVERLTHFRGTEHETVVDDPIADSIRSSANTSVGELGTWRGKMVAVDKVTGSCKFLPENLDKPLRGKITDPALAYPENVYTHALDRAVVIKVAAKPMMKDGEVATLYISDGSFEED